MTTPYCLIRPVLAAALLCGSAAARDAAVTAPLLPTDPPVADLQRARTTLQQWEDHQAERAPRLLRIVYWTPADREPMPEYRERLTRVMKHIQEFYRTQMTSYGFAGRTIQLDLGPDGLLRLPIAKGTLKSAECNEQDQSIGGRIRRDCIAELKKSGVDGERETVVIFCNLSDWDPVKRTMGHHSPYYASGDSTGGTAWQVDSPMLDSALLGVKDQLLTDRQYGHISVGKYNSIFVGGACHELGHALGLPHCRECAAARRTRGTALMGSGNRTYGEELRGESKGSFLTLPHALKLAAHPQFSGSVKQMRVPAKVDFSALKFGTGPQGMTVSGKLQSNLPCHAVLAYADPAGGLDYDAAISCAIPQPDGSFALTIPPTDARSKPALLSLVGVCANGAATAGVWSANAYSLPCRIDAQGGYDISPAVASQEVASHLAAARSGPLPPALAATLSPVAREALRRLSLPDSSAGKPAPAAVADSVKSLPLSDAAPATATTGYGGVHFDRTLEGGPLVGPDGPAAHGLWAHANSTFTYQLGGKWSDFAGRCALLKTGAGPVKATILLDGKPVWQSGKIEPGEFKPFSLKVAGTTTLTLVIEGIRGIGGANSAWLEPTLTR